MPDDAERRLLAQLFFDWVQQRTGEQPHLEAAPMQSLFAATLGDKRLFFDVEPVNTGERPAAWQASLKAFLHRLQPGEGGVLIWQPPGASFPDAEPHASAVAGALQQAIDALAPGETGEARLPITIGISKRDEAGAYVSAFGGLAPLWAQFTDRVQGYYQIDSTALHRLPSDEGYIRALVDRIVEASKGLALHEAANVDAEDCWRVQRLRGGDGAAIVALSPGDESENGAPLRRRLRSALREAAERLSAGAGDLRVLALYGHYPSLAEEPVGPALRGQDPSLFGGIDMVALIADGGVKPLIDITRRPLLQARP